MTKIFVFGSNLAGRHGAGSALEAYTHYGAIRGVGRGIQNHSYAIPTKDFDLKVLPLSEINRFVAQFIEFAKAHPEHTFSIVKIGCGLAGYREEQIAPMFIGSPSNVNLPKGWWDIINGD